MMTQRNRCHIVPCRNTPTVSYETNLAFPAIHPADFFLDSKCDCNYYDTSMWLGYFN